MALESINKLARVSRFLAPSTQHRRTQNP